MTEKPEWNSGPYPHGRAFVKGDHKLSLYRILNGEMMRMGENGHWVKAHEYIDNQFSVPWRPLIPGELGFADAAEVRAELEGKIEGARTEASSWQDAVTRVQEELKQVKTERDAARAELEQARKSIARLERELGEARKGGLVWVDKKTAMEQGGFDESFHIRYYPRHFTRFAVIAPGQTCISFMDESTRVALINLPGEPPLSIPAPQCNQADVAVPRFRTAEQGGEAAKGWEVMLKAFVIDNPVTLNVPASVLVEALEKKIALCKNAIECDRLAREMREAGE